MRGNSSPRDGAELTVGTSWHAAAGAALLWAGARCHVRRLPGAWRRCPMALKLPKVAPRRLASPLPAAIQGVAGDAPPRLAGTQPLQRALAGLVRQPQHGAQPPGTHLWLDVLCALHSGGHQLAAAHAR